VKSGTPDKGRWFFLRSASSPTEREKNKAYTKQFSRRTEARGRTAEKFKVTPFEDTRTKELKRFVGSGRGPRIDVRASQT